MNKLLITIHKIVDSYQETLLILVVNYVLALSTSSTEGCPTSKVYLTSQNTRLK